MATTVFIPTPLRPFTDQQATVQVAGSTVGEVLQNLVTVHPELRNHLYSADGKLRSFVNVYVNDEDIRYLQKEETAVKDSDTVSIVPSVAGGSPAGDPAVAPELNNDEVRRYSRHLIMPEVGVEGQRKLKQARVLCIGAGGLGSPASLYLAAAGVGTLGLVDFDAVDFSNLQRQVLFGTDDVGRPKIKAAAERLKSLNPNIRIIGHETALSSKNALDLFRDYDIIIDGTDNFPTRYLTNDACVLLGKPNVYGSIFRFDGQISVFATKGGPCYRCLYPEPPPPGLVPSCAEGGVLGVLPGVVGTIQATEAIKLILGVGDPLIGRLLLFDALQMKFRTLKLQRDPNCPVCGDNPTVKELIDYEQFCGITPATTADASGVSPDLEMSVVELKERLDKGDIFLLDVREPREYEINRIEGSTLIPLGELPRRLDELPKDRDIAVQCKSGMRSAKAVNLLREKGFTRVRNVRGGIQEWIARIDPDQPTY
ncbi:MAG: molybdopterin-synthase adenylyltransferase MoeB [Acidobacteriota bacterium]|jgi:molybdopterin/thiamine biosynthesis adenylyltransferase/rhodanese-related sulfurtransferase/molybdopterin converting factor small subunit|nr:MAG: molybdenum cofactor biosynthesis protein MoeB [Acidobacteriota bacterium]